MQRPMIALAGVWLAGSFLAGIGFCRTMAILLCYVIILVVLFFLGRKHPAWSHSYVTSQRYITVTVYLLALPCLFLLAQGRTLVWEQQQAQLAQPYFLLDSQGEQRGFVSGKIKEVVQDGEQQRLRLTDCVVSGYTRQTEQSAGDCIVLADQGEYRVGNRIWSYGEFRFFRAAGNPGQFQRKQYYERQGIFAFFSAVKTEITEPRGSLLGAGMQRLGQLLQDSLCQILPERDAGVLNAMLLGNKALLLEETKELYQKNGMAHILAISGLHVSLLCMGLYRLLRRCGTPRSWNLTVTAGFLLFYVSFTGGSTSGWRAAIMSLTLLLSYWCRRSYDMLSALCLAAILITAVNPAETGNLGFWLSFTAVLGVAAAEKLVRHLVEKPSGVLEEHPVLRAGFASFLHSAAVSFVTLPVCLWGYYEFAPYAVICNLLILPTVSLLLFLGLLAALLGCLGGIFAAPITVTLTAPFAGAVHLLLSGYEWVAELLQKLPYSYCLTGRPHPWQIAAYVCLLVLVGYVLVRRYYGAGMMLLAAALLVLVLRVPERFRLIFLDVSQGDGIVLVTDGETMVFDCGSSDVSGIGEYRLAPYLKQQGIALLDTVVLSHLDWDHISGIRELLEEMKPYETEKGFRRSYDGTLAIRTLILPQVSAPGEVYQALVQLANEKGVTVRTMEAGEGLTFSDGLGRLDCLSPKQAEESENETSLVIRLTYQTLLVWLMGDAGEKTEEWLLRTYGDSLAGEEQEDGAFVLLKVGHHGSRTSSGLAFLQEVQPDAALISCGYRNRYGHPHEETLHRLAAVGARLYSTKEDGAVTVTVDKRGRIQVRGYLEEE